MFKSVVLTLVLSIASGVAHAEESNPQPTENQILEAITVTSLALSEWNPRVKYQDLFDGFRQRIKENGLQQGLLIPMMNIIDASYVIGAPSIAKVMAPSIVTLAPTVGEKLNRDLGLPQRFPKTIKDANGDLSPDGISSLREGIRAALPHGMGEVKVNTFKPFEGDPVEIAFSGIGSAIQVAAKAPRAVATTTGPYSQRDIVGYGSCVSKCIEDSFSIGAAGFGLGYGVGSAIGAAAVVVVGPGAVITSGGVGFAVGSVGAAVGVAAGIDKCSASPECAEPKEGETDDIKEKDKSEDEEIKDDEDDENKDSDKDESKKKKKDKGTGEDKEGEDKTGRPVNDDERSRPKPKTREEQEKERKEKRDSILNPSRGDREPRTPEKNTQPGKESVILVTSEEKLRLPKVQKKPGPDISVVLPGRERLRSGGLK